MAGNGWTYWKWLDMEKSSEINGKGSKWLEMAEMDGNDQKLLKVCGKNYKWLELAGHGQTWLELLEMA